MHCAKANQRLQLYIDRQLTLTQMRELEMHITCCASCRRALFLLEAIDQSLQEVASIAEPADLTINIMRRVALSAHNDKQNDYVLLRPSLTELLVVVLLATTTTLGVIWQQPSLRESLPIANGYDLLSALFNNIAHVLMNVNGSMLMWVFWVTGTILGVWITLALMGAELRKTWIKAMMDRLPVH